jgi:aspartate racemase
LGDKVVGIIGGMGPEATVDLQQRVLRATPATDDADHIRMIVDNNPKIPSRIKALIEGTGESPLPVLQEMARKLAAYGADFLAIPCNTAHFYYGKIQSAVNIPVLNMVGLTVEKVRQDNPALKRVGILASRAVVMNELYTGPFRRFGIEVPYPAEVLQEDLMRIIKAVKTGRYSPEERKALTQAAADLFRQGAEILLVACTELSLLSDSLSPSVRLYDTAQVLAEGIVRAAKHLSQPAPVIFSF